MARKDQYKYVYIHGHDSQLFDLEKDPGEWDNLSGDPKHGSMEKELRSLILSKFDPDAIERDASESLRKRRLIKEANEINGVSWDYDPPFDASKMYWRAG